MRVVHLVPCLFLSLSLFTRRACLLFREVCAYISTVRTRQGDVVVEAPRFDDMSRLLPYAAKVSRGAGAAIFGVSPKPTAQAFMCVACKRRR